MKKRLMAIVLCLVLLVSLLAGCGGKKDAETETNDTEAVETEANGSKTDINENIDASVTGGVIQGSNALEITDDDMQPASSKGQNSNYYIGAQKATGITGISYVMVYNPLCYVDANGHDDFDAALQSTGTLKGKIVTGINRAGGLEEPDIPVMINTNELDAGDAWEDADKTGDRGSYLPKIYKVGDKEEFWRFTGDLSNRVKDTFKCIAVGEHCYVWTCDDSVSKNDALELVDEFDNYIFDNDNYAFGEGRFVEGKVHFFCFEMRQGLGGFFTTCDIFSSSEFTKEQAEKRGLNLDMAIISVNSNTIKNDMDFAKSTLAHEYQHQICASDCFYDKNTSLMRTWLNEAMSAYAEEYSYPGIKTAKNFNTYMFESDNFRNGQSLYNFENSNDPWVGAYGAVYLFIKMMIELGEDDVFYNVHEYWRTEDGKNKTEAKALYYGVSSTVNKGIDTMFEYPSNIEKQFKDEEYEWLSKLALYFHLVALDSSFSEISDSAYQDMIYDSVMPANIEGGGRVILAVKDNTYMFPADADKNLIYIGLDENFNIVTNLVVAN